MWFNKQHNLYFQINNLLSICQESEFIFKLLYFTLIFQQIQSFQLNYGCAFLYFNYKFDIIIDYYFFYFLKNNACIYYLHLSQINQVIHKLICNLKFKAETMQFLC